MSRLMIHRYAAAAAAAAALLLAACSAPGGGTSSTPSGRSGDVKFQLYQEPDSFNPFTSINGADSDIAELQYRPLLFEQAGTYVPMLASSWDVNSNATQYTFHLADTNWSDGKPFTSADVVYSFEMYTNPATASSYAGTLAGVVGADAYASGEATTISGITAPDAHTVVLKLTAPDASLLGTLVNLAIVPKHVFGSVSPKSFSGSQLFREPSVGIGPYIYAKWVTGDEVEFVPNKQSKEPHPLAHIYAEYLTADVAETQLQTGEIDIAQIGSTDAAKFKSNSKVKLYTAPGNTVMSLWTGYDNGLLADPRVRQAIMYAMDRNSIVKNVLAGNGTVVNTIVFLPSWAVPSSLNSYSYDPAKAKQLLAEAHWKASTPVNLDITPGQADRDATMSIIAGELQAVGINAKVTNLQPAQISSLITTNRKQFDLLISAAPMDDVDPGVDLTRFTCSGALNIQKYCNKQVDTLAAEGLATTDQAKRTQIYQQINQILNANVAAIPLYVEKQVWGTTDRIQGFEPELNIKAAQNWTVAS